MNTLFIFIEQIDVNNPLLSLSLDENGKLVLAKESRPLDELAKLSQHHETVVVLRLPLVAPKRVSLPTLKNAALTIPNLLEENLSQPLDELHFAISGEKETQGTYLVNVIDKTQIQSCLDKLNDNHIDTYLMVSDFQSHHDNAIYLTSDKAYIYQENQLGCVSIEELKHLSFDTSPSVYVFNDSHQGLVDFFSQYHINKVDLDFDVYVAQHYKKTNPINLLQGPFEKKKASTKRLTILTAACALVAFLMFSTFHLLQTHHLKKALNDIKARNFVLYQHFFPNAKTMISPRFRIEQLLKSEGQDKNSSQFFALIKRLSLARSKADAKNIKIDSFHYINGSLILRLKAKQFENLLHLQKQLENQSIKVSQLSAKSKSKMVEAKWSLKL